MADRTNILLASPPVPGQLDTRSLQAWVVGVEQTVRFRRTGRLLTSGAQTSSILSIQTNAGTVYAIKAYIVGRRTSGSGSLNDGYVGIVRATYKNVASTLTEIAEGSEFEETDIVGATVSFAPNDQKIEMKVTGASGYEMAWFFWSQTLLATI